MQANLGAASQKTGAEHAPAPETMNRRVAEREAELASAPGLTAWSELVQRALSAPDRQTKRNDTVPSGP
jgi:hypothetical protein